MGIYTVSSASGETKTFNDRRDVYCDVKYRVARGEQNVTVAKQEEDGSTSKRIYTADMFEDLTNPKLYVVITHTRISDAETVEAAVSEPQFDKNGKMCSWETYNTFDETDGAKIYAEAAEELKTAPMAYKSVEGKLNIKYYSIRHAFIDHFGEVILFGEEKTFYPEQILTEVEADPEEEENLFADDDEQKKYNYIDDAGNIVETNWR